MEDLHNSSKNNSELKKVEMILQIISQLAELNNIKYFWE